MSTIPGYYTVYEAIPVINRSHGQICRYIRTGLLPAKKLGHQLLIEQSAAHAFEPPPRGNPNFRNQNGENN